LNNERRFDNYDELRALKNDHSADKLKDYGTVPWIMGIPGSSGSD
jgi:hypothetical protein